MLSSFASLHLGAGLFLPKTGGTLSLPGHVSVGLHPHRGHLCLSASWQEWLFLSTRGCLQDSPGSQTLPKMQ